MSDVDAARTRLWPRSALLLIGASGFLGMAGVALSAAASHAGGGSLASTAGQFCVMHAGAALALAGAARTAPHRLFVWAGAVLVVGTALFAGDLATIAFGGWRPLPLAAPLGGMMMIGGWGLVVVASVAAAVGRRSMG